MIFWICVIIAVISEGVLFWAFNYVSKEQKEFNKLDADYEYWSDRCLYFPSGVSEYKRAIEERNKAFSARSQFKEKHPNLSKKKDRQERASSISLGVCIVAAVFCLIMGAVIGVNHIGAPETRAALEAEYEVLSWEVENDVYTDGGDDVVGKKELYNNVRAWNAELAKKKVAEKNFWYGIFVPNIYSDLKPIELK